MHWLDGLLPDGTGTVTRQQMRAFTWDGEPLPLMDVQRGIYRPRSLAAALSICTVYTPPTQRPPYDDQPGPDGLLRYKYRDGGPRQADNVALRLAYENQLPLIWFYGSGHGVYVPIYPVWIAADEPQLEQFALALDIAQVLAYSPVSGDENIRRYALRETHLRLHQPVFRAQVLGAYDLRCAVCTLRHPTLLDAAHIIPDGRPHGDPIVPNGLSLCKIHHAAFDQNILGIRPDLKITIREDVLEERDGPMLRHGLQEMDGRRLLVPRSHAQRPDPERLEERYVEFAAAT